MTLISASFSSVSILAWASIALPALSSYSSLLLPVLMLGALYFLMIVPNQRKQKDWQAQLEKVKPTDKVSTTGGMRGVVIAVKDDVVIVRTAPDGVKFEFLKSAIATVSIDDEAKA